MSCCPLSVHVGNKREHDKDSEEDDEECEMIKEVAIGIDAGTTNL